MCFLGKDHAPDYPICDSVATYSWEVWTPCSKEQPSPLCLVARTHGGAVGNDAGLYRTSV